MKIVIFGSNASWAIEKIYMRNLIQLGHEVILFDAALYYNTNTILQRVLYRLLPSLLFRNVNEKLLNTINWKDVDVLFVFKGIELFKETLLGIKKFKVILANYNPDHPFIRTFASSGGKNIMKCLSAYDIHFSYSKKVLKEIKSIYNCELFYLPFAYDPSYLDSDVIFTQRELVKLCFVGNPDRIRVDLIQKIVSWGFEVDLYGKGWERYFSENKYVNCCGVLEYKNLYTTLNKYRVQLNIFRPHNKGAHNMRTFEIAGAGGIQLAPYSEDHVNFFDENKEFFLYRNDVELKVRILQLLNLSTSQSEIIRKNVVLRSKLNNYSYESRAEFVSECFIKYQKSN